MRGIPRQAVHRNLPVLGTDKTARDAARFNSICQWNPDMYGVTPDETGRAYYDSIFQLYAEWGVDFIKCDDICRELPHEEAEMVMLSEALNGCGREMVHRALAAHDRRGDDGIRRFYDAPDHK